jgi:hypothetical protein
VEYPFWLFAVVLIIADLLPGISKKHLPAKASLSTCDNHGSSRLITQG